MAEGHSRGTCSTVSVQLSELLLGCLVQTVLGGSGHGVYSMATQQPAQPQHEMCELVPQSKNFSTGGSRI